MNKNLLPQKATTGKDRVASEEIQETIYPNQYEENIADGGEFLDDGIRMKDQPLDEPAVRKEE